MTARNPSARSMRKSPFVEGLARGQSEKDYSSCSLQREADIREWEVVRISFFSFWRKHVSLICNHLYLLQKKKFITTLNVLNNVYFLLLMLNVNNDPVQQVTTYLNKSFTRKRMVHVKIPNILFHSLQLKTHSLKRYIFENENNSKDCMEPASLII